MMFLTITGVGGSKYSWYIEAQRAEMYKHIHEPQTQFETAVIKCHIFGKRGGKDKSWGREIGGRFGRTEAR